MAIIIPHEAHLRNTLAAKGVDSTSSLADLCLNPAVQEVVLKEANAVGKKNGFKANELLQAVVLTPDEWTPESGLVTAAQKIQRAKIAKTFRSQIDVCVLSSRVTCHLLVRVADLLFSGCLHSRPVKVNNTSTRILRTPSFWSFVLFFFRFLDRHFLFISIHPFTPLCSLLCNTDVFPMSACFIYVIPRHFLLFHTFLFGIRRMIFIVYERTCASRNP